MKKSEKICSCRFSQDEEEINSVLECHLKKYPEMKVKDIIKLCYQNEFGPGHMIRDKNHSLEMIENEINYLRDRFSLSGDKFLPFEYIGNNKFRYSLVNLLNKNEIKTETLNEAFCLCAEKTKPDMDAYEKKILSVKKYLEKEKKFDKTEIERHFSDHIKNGYIHTVHSSEYKKAYNPAYRIVDSMFRKYYEFFSMADSISQTEDFVTVAIEGNSGSGKTFLSKYISEIYDANVFHMDDFFLQPHQRKPNRTESPDGNVDYKRFRSEVLNNIISGKSFCYRKYNCQTGNFSEPVKITPKKINVIEGSYSCHPILSENYSIKIFLKADSETCKERILRRNGPQMLERFIKEWIPMENNYFRTYNTEKKSDIIFYSTPDIKTDIIM